MIDLTLVMVHIFYLLHSSQFFSAAINLQHSSCKHVLFQSVTKWTFIKFNNGGQMIYIGLFRENIIKLEDLKVLRRSPDLLNNVKIGQG